MSTITFLPVKSPERAACGERIGGQVEKREEFSKFMRRVVSHTQGVMGAMQCPQRGVGSETPRIINGKHSPFEEFLHSSHHPSRTITIGISRRAAPLKRRKSPSLEMTEGKGESLYTSLLQFSNTILSLLASPSYIIPTIFLTSRLTDYSTFSRELRILETTVPTLTKARYPYDEI